MKSLDDKKDLSPIEEDDVLTYSPIFSFIQRILPLGFQKMPDDEESTQRKEVLKGKPLQVYWYLLTHGAAGVREIQKSLNFSSPGVVSYQLNKLSELGIISQHEDSDKYYIKEEVKSGILGFYVRVGYRMIPRFSIYLSLFICGFLAFFVFSFTMGDGFITHPGSILLFLFLTIGTLVFVFESRKIWKIRPD
ncbi:MAG: winged helix-turn-helix domain-containing protein [Promethearchaeota archaeon]